VSEYTDHRKQVENLVNARALAQAAKLEEQIAAHINQGVSPDRIEIILPRDDSDPWVRVNPD